MDSSFDNEVTRIHLRIERGVKKDAEKVFDRLGINMSHAIRMFLIQVVVNKGIPFKPTLETYPYKNPFSPDTELESLLKSFSEKETP